MNKARLREKWRNKDYVGLPQWFIDEMVDEERLEKKIDDKKQLKIYREWLAGQYWPKSKWGL